MTALEQNRYFDSDYLRHLFFPQLPRFLIHSSILCLLFHLLPILVLSTYYPHTSSTISPPASGSIRPVSPLMVLTLAFLAYQSPVLVDTGTSNAGILSKTQKWWSNSAGRPAPVLVAFVSPSRLCFLLPSPLPPTGSIYHFVSFFFSASTYCLLA